MPALAWSLLGVALLLLALLLVPMELRVDARWNGRAQARSRLTWLFGLVSTDLGVQAPRRPAETPERSLRRLLDAWRDRGFRAAARRLLRRLRRATRVREASLAARVGLGDPADTGLAFGLLAPLAAVLAAAVPVARLDVRPDWGEEPVLAAEARAHLRWIPLVVLAALLAFAMAPATWRALRAWRRA